LNLGTFEPPQGFEWSEAVEPFDTTQGRLLERLERLFRESLDFSHCLDLDDGSAFG
jgi:hypothetical protein